MDHGGSHRREVARGGDQRLVARAAFVQVHLRQKGARPPDLLGRRDHLGHALDHHFTGLVGAKTVENQAAFFRLFLPHRHPHRHRFAQSDRAAEVQRLIEVDRAGSGQFGPKQRGNQRAAPHPVGDDLVEQIGLGVGLVDMGGIDVPGHDGEKLDVFAPQRSNQLGRLANLDLVECFVLDIVDLIHRTLMP